MVLEQWDYPYFKKKKFDLYLYLNILYKNNYIAKLLEENLGKISDFGLEKEFFDMTSKENP